MGAEMDLSDETRAGVTVVKARGRLDAASSGMFAERLGGLVSGAQPRLVIDFAEVDFVSSAGLRAVLILVKKVKAANGMFALCAVQGPVREVLDITGFTTMIAIHPELSSALAAMA
jgi:anti-sigma B factor antagonist